MTTRNTTDNSGRRLVHPRWVWGGLVVAVVGLALLGLGIILLSVAVSGFGAVLLLGGAVTSTAGGIIYDNSPRLRAREEIRQVHHGQIHEGPAPGDMLAHPQAQRDALETQRQSDAILSAHPSTPLPLAPIAGWTLLLICGFIVLSQQWFIAHTATGRDSAFRDAGMAILIGLAGIRIATASSRTPGAIGVALAGSLALTLAGFIAPHDRPALAMVEVACGVCSMFAGMAALARPYTPSSRDPVGALRR